MSKLKLVTTALFIFFIFKSSAQLSENFSDGDFTNNPPWVGNTTEFIINSALQLQSNSQTQNTTFYLSTQNSLATNTQWEFYCKLDFNTSSKNYVDVFLISSTSNLNLVSNTGYFVRIGNTLDNICLYIKKDDGTITKLIDGAYHILNKSKNELKIKVIRNVNDKWTLYRDITATGNAYVSEGSAIDNTYKTTAYFGFLIRQSTSGFFKKHFFDDITIKEYRTVVPKLISANAKTKQQLDILFNEPLNEISATTLSNYFIDNNIGYPDIVSVDPQNNSLIHLIFKKEFPADILLTISVDHLQDNEGNIFKFDYNFTYHFIKQYDLVIDEIMADPLPVMGLPKEEWIEIKNNSGIPINLNGFTITKGNRASESLPDTIIKPDSFAIICKPSALPLLNKFGTSFGLKNFPILANKGETISLVSSEHNIIHAVNYSIGWYKNNAKKNGGWTLEMIDTKSPCEGESDWQASEDISGGTPGRKNSIDGNLVIKNPLLILIVYPVDELHLNITFNKGLDSLSISNKNNYILSDGLFISAVRTLGPLFDQVQIVLTNPIIKNKVYTIKPFSIKDCEGLEINTDEIKFGLESIPDSLDLVINEILFHPKPNGAKYVEVYNRSDKIINLKKINIAHKNNVGNIINYYPLSKEDKLLFPQEFALITTDTTAVFNQYLITNKKAFIQIDKLPPMPYDSGTVLIRYENRIIDEVDYSDRWHFQLLSNTEGVSLERINYNGPSVSSNFHSASTSSGYGTPGYKNSQYLVPKSIERIRVHPEIISPDNDGEDDFAIIEYNFDHPGTLASIVIYDDHGVPVRSLIKNAVNGITGSFIWDGLGENKQQLKMGIYIIITEILDTVSGKKERFKNVIVVARK